jgi:hypothetical protein
MVYYCYLSIIILAPGSVVRAAELLLLQLQRLHERLRDSLLPDGLPSSVLPDGIVCRGAAMLLPHHKGLNNRGNTSPLGQRLVHF